MRRTVPLSCLLLAVLTLSPVLGADVWTPATSGAFTATTATAFPDEGGPSTVLLFSYPGQSVSEPGQGAEFTRQLAGGGGTLSFRWTDSFTGPTAGYHLLQVLFGERVLWEGDVAGGTGAWEKVEVALPGAPAADRLTFRLTEKKQVTNFPLTVQVGLVRLTQQGRATELLPAARPGSDPGTWPAEAPLPQLPPNGWWTAAAAVVQPWGKTQTSAVREAAHWAPLLAEQYGFTAVILLPPAAHNAITAETDHVTEAEFEAAVTAYREAGLRLILYSSIMHLGHDPRWQQGELAREHPEWAMRDAKGNPVTIYGQPWLCPSTGALDYTLQYTADLVKRYRASGVMLDNNEFMSTAAGLPTCYCDGCRRAFAADTLKRFGADGLRRHFSLRPEQVKIPTQASQPLWPLWLAWRNRVWGRACETFREGLRKVDPAVVVLANAQYVYRDWQLAVDRQYPHLDAVLSESRFLDAAGMGAKMLLGRALVPDRPLWNYIGTFDERNYELLRPPAEVAGVCAASCGFAANPWLVFYGFTGEQNAPALEMIRRYTAFWHEQWELLSPSRPEGEVRVVFSTESRDLAGALLPARLLGALLKQGEYVAALRDAPGLTAKELEHAQVLVATGLPCCRDDTARAIVARVREGATAIVCPDAAWRDERGYWRSNSAFAREAGLRGLTLGDHPCGKGRLLVVRDDAEAEALVRKLLPPRVQAAAPVALCWNVLRTGPDRISLIGLEGEIGTVTIDLPRATEFALLHVPGRSPQALRLSKDRRRATITVPDRLAIIECSS